MLIVSHWINGNKCDDSHHILVPENVATPLWRVIMAARRKRKATTKKAAAKKAAPKKKARRRKRK